jgi:hypothetical protein
MMHCDVTIPAIMITPWCTDGDNKKEREQELKMMMKRLEAKYAALQVMLVISKLGTPKVRLSMNCIAIICCVT